MVHINMKLKREPFTIDQIENSQANFEQVCKGSGIDSITKGAILKCFDQAVLYALEIDPKWNVFNPDDERTWPKKLGPYLVHSKLHKRLEVIYWPELTEMIGDVNQAQMWGELFDVSHWQVITFPKGVK